MIETILSQSCRLEKFKISFTGPKSRFWQDHTPAGDSGKEYVPCFFHHVVAANIPWLVVTSVQPSKLTSSKASLLHLHIVFSVYVTSCCFAFKWIFVNAFRVYADNLDHFPILGSFITPEKPLPYRITFINFNN